MGPPAADP